MRAAGPVTHDITGGAASCSRVSRSGLVMDVMYSRWAMTQGSEGLNCLVAVHVPSVPHAAALSHSAAPPMLFLWIAAREKVLDPRE